MTTEPPFQVHAAARRGRRGMLSAAAGLMILGVVLAGCKDKTDPKAAQAPQGPTPVSVVPVVKKPVNQGSSFIGRVEAIKTVDMIARVSGFIERQAYTDGEEVKAGDLLFVLEKDTYQATVNEARATLAQAEANAANAELQVRRARALVRNGNIAVATLDNRETAVKQAAAEIQAARANLDQARINLNYTEMRAPFAGRVGRANFKLGALVGPTTGTLATVVSQDPVYVTFPVSDRLVTDFRRQVSQHGDKAYDTIRVRMFLSNGEEYPTAAKVDFTDVRVDRGTDTLLVRAVVPNGERLLVDGQYVRVVVERVEPVEVLVVPQRAILTDQSGTSVFIVGQDKKASRKSVKTGQVIATDTVVDGLNEGDLVIVDGLQTLQPGASVDAKLADGTPGAAGGAPGAADGTASRNPGT